jgi:hypothetical protein
LVTLRFRASFSTRTASTPPVNSAKRAAPEDFKKLAAKKGLLKPEVKAMEIVAWLKKDHGLGHGHAMSIYATFKGVKEWK